MRYHEIFRDTPWTYTINLLGLHVQATWLLLWIKFIQGDRIHFWGNLISENNSPVGVTHN